MPDEVSVFKAVVAYVKRQHPASSDELMQSVSASDLSSTSTLCSHECALY